MKRGLLFLLLSLAVAIVMVGCPAVAQPTWEQMVYSEKEYKGQPVEMTGMVLGGDYSNIINSIIIATGSTDGKNYNSALVSVWISDRNLGTAPKDGSIVKVYGSYKMMYSFDKPIGGYDRIPVIDGSSVRTII